MATWSEILDLSVAGGADSPHIAALRLPTLDGWERGRVWANWKVEDDFVIPLVGTLFGGYIAALADHVLGLSVMTVLEDAEHFSTTELQVNLFRPVRDGMLEIEAVVVTRGRRSAYCELRLTRPAGKLIARAGATQAILAAGARESREATTYLDVREL